MSIEADGRSEGPQPQPRHAKKDPRPQRRIIATVITLSIGFAIFLPLAWVASRALMVKSELEQAELLVDQARLQVEERDFASLPDTFAQAHTHVQRAREVSGDPVWGLLEVTPRLGRNLEALRELTEFLDDAMRASEPLVDLAPQFDPATLVPRDGKVPVEPFVNAAEVLPPFVEEFNRLGEQLDAIPVEGTVPQIQSTKARLVDVFDRGQEPLEQAVPLVELVPTLLGVDGPRTYVVMFQNNAELRSLGGTALSFAEISVDEGAIELQRVVPAGFKNFPSHAEPVILVPEGFEDLYPKALGRFIANATLRPSSITAAKIVQAEWQIQFGKPVDGVISMDGPALSALLSVVGPITLSTGDEVTGDNVIDLLFHDVYQRYNSGNSEADNVQQDVIYTETVQKTFGQLTSGAFEPLTLWSAMSDAAAADNLTVWLSNQTDFKVLEPTPFEAAGLPASTPTTDVVGLYLNDQVGSKLGYYLQTVATTSSGMCGPDGRQVHRVSLAVTNTLDPAAVEGLSPSISGGAHDSLGLAKGVQRYVVFAYLPEGSTFLSVTSDVVPSNAAGYVDEGHPTQVLWVHVPPGATGTVSVDVLMDAPGERELEAAFAPTLHGTVVNKVPLDCSTVTLP